MERFICVHGHFYQPPRENPWMEELELQKSAFPYHDWNERITAECYGPNGAARLLDKDGRITGIVNNYAHISFNFGPTLLCWLERNDERTYQRILAADRESLDRFSGHGSALAQAYNHAILPLCNERDRRTQVVWGLRDFELRFDRKAEGMWLPETAVDLASLEELAEHGVLFTILAPRQARRIRKIGDDDWTDTKDGSIDPKRAYTVRLPSGRSLTLFFYDGPISQAVAFEGLLHDGPRFVSRLMSGFSDQEERPELVHVGTDGESYGHHHHFGEMALAYALKQIEDEGLARITNCGEFLELHPPSYEVEIYESSSWSCAHGVERWRSDCGCNAGRGKDWNQKWRGPLREALDELRDGMAEPFETQAARLLTSPWEARDLYVDLVTNRSRATRDEFFRRSARRALSAEEQQEVLELLEMQRHAMQMYTSCGWFFDDPSGIETVQNLAYAGRAMQLASVRFGEQGERLEGEFLSRLEGVLSNDPAEKNGRVIYEWRVLSQIVGFEHFVTGEGAAQRTGPSPQHFGYTVTKERETVVWDRGYRLLVGEARVTSTLTLESKLLTFAAASAGDERLIGSVAELSGNGYERLLEAIQSLPARSGRAGAQRTIETFLGPSRFEFTRAASPAPVTAEARMQGRVDAIVAAWRLRPASATRVRKVLEAVSLAQSRGFRFSKERLQVFCIELVGSTLPLVQAEADRGNRSAREWISKFSALRTTIGILVE